MICRICQREGSTAPGVDYCADCRMELRQAAVAAVRRDPRMPALHALALLSFAKSLIVRGER